MSHTTIYFLTKAENLEKAEYRINEFLESEHFFDCFTVLPESYGRLYEKLDKVNEIIRDANSEKSAKQFLSQAEEQKASGNLKQYGYYLIKAGELYAQYLTIDTFVFNIDEGDYSIPLDEKGWKVIAVDFHY